MDWLCYWYNYNNIIALWNNSGSIKVRYLEYLNEMVQGLIVLLLVYNAIKTKTLTLYPLIVTLIGVLFNFYTRYVSKESKLTENT